MNILLAPNAFKNSLSATNAANSLKEGIEKECNTYKVVCCPVADGGDGTGDLLMEYLGAEKIIVKTINPIEKKISTYYGWVEKNKTAIIELANASGVKLLQPQDYNPLVANTSGTGLLIKAALERNVQRIILCIGGSATVDGGTGILKCLGIRFLDNKKNEIKNLPQDLLKLSVIDVSKMDKRMLNTQMLILCDVKNKLVGEEGAAKVFGPQKGASNEDVLLLEKKLTHFNKVVFSQTGIEMSLLPHSGAAGGVGAALSVFCNAKLQDGITTFLELISFEKYLNNADLVITGEGSLDAQTLQGKAPFGVALAAREKGIKVIGVAGQVSPEDKQKLLNVFDEIICINPKNISIEEAMHSTSENLVKTGIKIAKKIRNLQF